MKHLLCLGIILLVPAAFGQDQPKRIGEIEFFGYSGSDLKRIRAALPFHEQDDFSIESFGGKIEQAGEAIKTVTGQTPTDIAPVCCDDQGNWIIYIGLSGKPTHYNPLPKGTTRLPENVLNLYERFIKIVMEDVQKGDNAEDHSQGYALSTSPPLRAVQLEMRAYAVGHEALLRKVLETSADDKQRIAAAELLGYARQSKSQLATLARANQDRNDKVRNNAIRALLVLADSSPKIAREIPAASFIDLLLSGIWSDLNKASGLLFILTRKNNATLMASLRRREVLDRLIEMARWRTGHGEPARTLLGRIAGIDERRLGQLVKTGQVEAIIHELERK